MRNIHEQEVQVKTVRRNVIPVFVIPTIGRETIEMSGKMVNFAPYVVSQGGFIVFTQEFERYIEQRYGKQVDFQKLFNAWYKNGEGKIDFTKYLTEYLLAPGKP
jgi:hypothetical protein